MRNSAAAEIAPLSQILPKTRLSGLHFCHWQYGEFDAIVSLVCGAGLLNLASKAFCRVVHKIFQYIEL